VSTASRVGRFLSSRQSRRRGELASFGNPLAKLDRQAVDEGEQGQIINRFTKMLGETDWFSDLCYKNRARDFFSKLTTMIGTNNGSGST
jgi:hypothetical protein